MLNLYQIADEYLHVLHNLEHVPDDELEGKLDELNQHTENFEATAINMAAFIKNLEAEEQAVRYAVDQYAERAKNIENRIIRLKSFIQNQMQKLQIDKINKDPLHKLMRRMNPPSVQVSDIHIVPEEHFAVKQARYLDKIALKEKLLAGAEIPGCQLVRLERLDIR